MAVRNAGHAPSLLLSTLHTALSLPAAFFAWLDQMSDEIRKTQKAAELNALSDEQLARLGIARDQIFDRVFGQKTPKA